MIEELSSTMMRDKRREVRFGFGVSFWRDYYILSIAAASVRREYAGNGGR